MKRRQQQQRKQLQNFLPFLFYHLPMNFLFLFAIQMFSLFLFWHDFFLFPKPFSFLSKIKLHFIHLFLAVFLYCIVLFVFVFCEYKRTLFLLVRFGGLSPVSFALTYNAQFHLLSSQNVPQHQRAPPSTTDQQELSRTQRHVSSATDVVPSAHLFQLSLL